MLPERELTTAALRIIDAELASIAKYDQTERIDELLCVDCPPADCGRDPDAAGCEIRAVHQQLRDAVAVLRLELGQYAAARNVTIPAA